METNQTECKNCSQPFEAGFNFCPHCGQKSKDDLTLGVLFYNTISNYFSFDARFFKSFIPLMARPGYVARQFVGGKRLQFLHPAQYYLFVSVIFFFLFSFKAREYSAGVDKALEQGFKKEFIIDDEVLEKADSVKQKLDSVSQKKFNQAMKDTQKYTGMTDEELQKLDSIMINENDGPKTGMTFNYDAKKVDSLIAIDAPDPEILQAMGLKEDAGFFTKRFYQQALKFQKNSGGGILQAFFDSIPIALFFLLPIFAMILKLFYWRRGRFSHHLVFSFYFFSFLFVVMCLVLGVNFFVDIPDWIDWLIVMSTFFYLILALRHFYQQNFFWSLIKGWMVTFVYMLFIVPMALGIMLGASFFFY